jgi:glycosyltransferase involved in cell wall biosynthesis
MSQITILMASYNGARYLPEQLASIAAQTHSNWRLIISDDGSSDATCAIIDAFAATYPFGKVLRVDGPRQGATANFLTLLQQTATGSGFTAFADQDDIWHPTKLAKGLEYLKNTPDSAPAVYGCRVNIITENGRFVREGPTRPRGPSLRNAMVQNIIGGHGALLNPAGTAVLRAATRVPFPAYHDWWLYLLMTAVGGVVILDPNPRLDYRQHGSNLLGTNHDIRSKLRRLRWIGSRDITRWIDENMVALEAASSLTSLDTQNFLAKFNAMRRLKGPRALRALHRLGLHRQRRLETLALYWAAYRGQL